MQINSIYIQGVTTHKGTLVDLPTSGIVLITGSNGAGKSSVLESVPLCLWGKSLRGTSLWKEGGDSRIRLTTHDRVYLRTRKGKKAFLSWTGSGEYETCTNAQKALTSMIGPMDVWTRVCVFSSAQANSFMSAGDADRTRILETLLGLSTFQDASSRVRVLTGEAEQTRSLAAAKISGLERSIESMEATLAIGIPDTANGDEEELGAKVEALREEYKDTKARLDHAKAFWQEQWSASCKLTSQQSVERSKYSGIMDKDVCPSCAQGVPAEHKDHLSSQVQSEVTGLAKSIHALESECVPVEQYVRELDEQAKDLAARGSAAKEALSGYFAGAAVRAIHKSTQGNLDRAREELSTLSTEVDKADRDLRHYKTLAKVFGPKGARAAALEGALDALEAAANRWLHVLADGDLRLTLRPYKTKTSGGVSTSLGVEVEGAGAGLGYRASSGGERRRIDLAITAALSEVAEAAAGWEKSTLWFDEAFGALDADGVEAATTLVRELSKTRCVVVISHIANQEHFPGATVYRIG